MDISSGEIRGHRIRLIIFPWFFLCIWNYLRILAKDHHVLTTA